MYKYNFYVGMFDKDEKLQTLNNTEFLNRVRSSMRLHNIDNYTIIKAKGHYKSDTMVVCEPTIIVEVIQEYANDNFMQFVRDNLARLVNQESILLTKQELQIL